MPRWRYACEAILAVEMLNLDRAVQEAQMRSPIQAAADPSLAVGNRTCLLSVLPLQLDRVVSVDVATTRSGWRAAPSTYSERSTASGTTCL
jgi:hypothetical protein